MGLEMMVVMEGLVVVVAVLVMAMVMVRMEVGDDSCGGADEGSIGDSEGFGNKLISGTYSGFLTSVAQPASWDLWPPAPRVISTQLYFLLSFACPPPLF